MFVVTSQCACVMCGGVWRWLRGVTLVPCVSPVRVDVPVAIGDGGGTVGRWCSVYVCMASQQEKASVLQPCERRLLLYADCRHPLLTSVKPRPWLFVLLCAAGCCVSPGHVS